MISSLSRTKTSIDPCDLVVNSVSEIKNPIKVLCIDLNLRYVQIDGFGHDKYPIVFLSHGGEVIPLTIRARGYSIISAQIVKYTLTVCLYKKEKDSKKRVKK